MLAEFYTRAVVWLALVAWLSLVLFRDRDDR